MGVRLKPLVGICLALLAALLLALTPAAFAKDRVYFSEPSGFYNFNLDGTGSPRYVGLRLGPNIAPNFVGGLAFDSAAGTFYTTSPLGDQILAGQLADLRTVGVPDDDHQEAVVRDAPEGRGDSRGHLLVAKLQRRARRRLERDDRGGGAARELEQRVLAAVAREEDRMTTCRSLHN